MTFGIDIATRQGDIDLGRAKAEGVEFVVVKMGGLNVTPQYVAPNYRAQIDKAVAAGLPKGHYYLIGKGQTPEQQAEFFVANLYGFDRERDILALDNEALDSNGTRWGDADAARFAKRVLELTGLPAHRFWHYAGATDYRATGSWPQLVALGIRFWWAAYGGYPTGHTPDHEPSLQGSIPDWDVHQFSSLVKVAGYSLDGNYSRATVAELFGDGMPRTLQGVIDWARANPKRDGGSWSGWCASFVYRAGGFSRAFTSAQVAGDYAGPLNPDWGSAPAGAIHYWSGVYGNGHCAFELGDGLLLMASGSVTDSWGTAMGTVTFQDYARLGIPYRGWSRRWGAETLASSGTAGGVTTPIEEIQMPVLIKHPNGSVGYVSDGGELDAISDINEMNAIIAVGLTNGKLLPVTTYMWDLLTRRSARLRASRATSVDVDEAAIVSGIVPLLVPAVVSALEGVGSGLTTEQVAAVTEAAVRKVFGDAAA